MSSRLAGPAAGAAVFALTVTLAFDAGGFHPVSWDRTLAALAVLGLLLVLFVGADIPRSGPAAVLAGSLAALTAWTALSWFWSDSPPAALEEAQRVALYATAAVLLVLVGRLVPLAWIAGAVLAAIALACTWDLLTRLAPDWTRQPQRLSDIGGLADPVGYANAVALLAAMGVLLALASPATAPLLVPFAAVLGLQASLGADVALLAGLLVFALAARSLPQLALLSVLPALGAVAVARDSTVGDPPHTDLHAAAASGHRLLGLLAALAVAQFAVARIRIGSRRIPAWPAVGLLVVVPFLFHGHEREHYWRAAVHEIVANPLLGSGAGTFVDWWLRVRDVALPTQEAHSLYLETLAELGPLGLVLVATALGSALVAAFRLRAPAVLGALVVYAVGAAVDFDWELAGATMPAIALGAAAAAQATPGARHRTWLPATAFAALAAAALLALAGNTAIADGNGVRAVRVAPYSADAWIVLARARARARERQAARAAYLHATRLDPNDWEAWVELASVSSGEPRRLALARAARLNPLGGR